jgi:alanine racemase
MQVVPFRTWAEVSRERIAANFRSVRSAVGPAVEVAAVVKADAYGHGAVEVSRVLAAEGAKWFAVSCVDEGVLLRDAGIKARILVMADYFAYSRAALVEYGLTPVLHTLGDLRDLDSFARSRNASLPFHLKVDTGMGRLGTLAGAEEIACAVRDAANLKFEGLMTHFASSADYTRPQTENQMAAFATLSDALCARGVSPLYVHMASTNPIAFGRREAWHNMVRPGHALYGYLSPARGAAPQPVLDVAPALQWKARILTTKELPAGSLIGYGGIYCASRPMRIAVLGVGYADGLSHRLSNRGHVIAAGKLVPILGAISMDVTTIDITNCPSLKAGDTVTLLGSEGTVSINAQQMARMAGTISYDILCGIRTRVRRVYV